MTTPIATATITQPQGYKSTLLTHLGLVAGMFDELGVGELLDQLIPQDGTKRVLSLGQAVKAMVLNGLGFANRALYLSPLFFQDKPVERLLGQGITAAHVNDDTLGRALDAIFSYGPSKLYSQLAARAVTRLGLLCRCVHLDSTSFHTDGEYNSDAKPEEGVVHVTRGYSRDHRPDLNQVVLQLLCEQQAGIPLLMEPLSGNRSDKESFRQTVTTHVAQLQADFGLKYVIADSALYAAETLQEMNDFFWISRVPETLTLACDIIGVVAPDLMRSPEQMSYRSLGAVYGDVRQRWLVVYSPQAAERARKTLDKQCLAQSSDEMKAFSRLTKQDFACEADAFKALKIFEKKLKMTCVAEVRVTPIPRYHGKGRPAQGRGPDSYLYRLEGALASRLAERTRRLERKSCFILATNQLDCQALPDEELLAAYKSQQKVEHGFRFLKDPQFLAANFYLKSPQRLMALLMVMTLCLLVYAALEYRIRGGLHTQGQSFPNQKGALITNPTARWVFQFFSGIHLLSIVSNGQAQELVLNLTDHHQRLLKVLGTRYETLYCASG